MVMDCPKPVGVKMDPPLPQTTVNSNACIQCNVRFRLTPVRTYMAPWKD